MRKSTCRPVGVFVLWIVLILSLCETGQGATFSCPAGDVQCLISAMNDSNANGEVNTIQLQAGAYSVGSVNNSVHGSNGLPAITGVVTIQGVGAVQTTILRGTALQFRFFDIEAGGSLTIDSLTVVGGETDPRGSSQDGGAFYNAGGILNITRSVVTQNVASSGGAIFSNRGSINIDQSTISDNDANVGAAFLQSGAVLRMSQSRFTGNGAVHEGGGLYLISGSKALIVRSTFDNNFADGGGGIIIGGGGSQVSSTLFMIGSSMTNNGGGPNGGSAIANLLGDVVLVDVTVSDPFSLNASAIDNSGTMRLLNSTLSGNRLAIRASTAVLIQNTLIGNSSSGSDCQGAVQSQGNNVIQSPGGCNLILQSSDVIGDPGLGPMADDGSAGNAHFPLLSTSPAINAGNAAACPATDQLGRPWIRCDIGSISFRRVNEAPTSAELQRERTTDLLLSQFGR